MMWFVGCLALPFFAHFMNQSGMFILISYFFSYIQGCLALRLYVSLVLGAVPVYCRGSTNVLLT